ncbi:MAG: hypothetical protein KDA61_04385 [Planctomycetales bacterium]|nr:hypothetical protein [Planctomycetales bacterium]
MRISMDFGLRMLAAVALGWSCHTTSIASAQPVAPYVPSYQQATPTYNAGPTYSYQQMPRFATMQQTAAPTPSMGYGAVPQMQPQAAVATPYVAAVPTDASSQVFGAPQAPSVGTAPYAPAQGYLVPTGAPIEVALGRGCPTGGCAPGYGQACSVPSACDSGMCGPSGCSTGTCATGACSTGGCATGACGTGGMDYTCFGGSSFGGCGGYTTYGCGLAGGLGNHLGGGCNNGCGNGNYWFGGVYGLYMDVDTSSYMPLAFAANGLAAGAYPTRADFVLYADDADPGYQGGVEVRMGRTFGASYDSCGNYYGPRWGLEGVYWQLFEDSELAVYRDDATNRTYSMSDFRGLEMNPGTGYRPANHYVDYAPPVSDYTNGGAFDLIEVSAVCVRRSFELTNVELNLLKISLCGGGGGVAVGPMAAGGGVGGGYGGFGSGMGGCSDGSCGPNGCAYNGGYATRGQGCGGSRFSCSGVCGVRYLQIDETFRNCHDFFNTVTLMPGYLNRHINAENSLIGFQTGCNGVYRLGCRWGVHVNTLMGVYANDIDIHHYFEGSGPVRFIGTTEAADVRASKTDVALLGELRVGLSYLATSNCRVYGGWRAIGVSGVALATDQVPVAYTDAAALRWLDSDGGFIVHGLQTGLEWNY